MDSVERCSFAVPAGEVRAKDKYIEPLHKVLPKVEIRTVVNGGAFRVDVVMLPFRRRQKVRAE